MRKKKFTSWGIAWLLGCCLMLSACSSDEALQTADGMGAVQLSLTAGMGFDAKTKAVDEGNYLMARPLANYTVQIISKKDGSVVPDCEWAYKDVPKGLIELPSGDYTIVAFDGKEFNQNASTRQGIYMYGETPLTVNSDQVAKKSVRCTPACGKLEVKFGADMEKHFSDYAVHFSTQAVSANGQIIWPKSDTDPLYVKLDKAGEKVTATFHITTKTGKVVNIKPLERDMKWGTRWVITVNPKVEDTTGKVGITITFDDSTNDKPIDIEIPSDWL